YQVNMAAIRESQREGDDAAFFEEERVPGLLGHLAGQFAKELQRQVLKLRLRLLIDGLVQAVHVVGQMFDRPVAAAEVLYRDAALLELSAALTDVVPAAAAALLQVLLEAGRTRRELVHRQAGNAQEA